jgi:hypothetical protein
MKYRYVYSIATFGRPKFLQICISDITDSVKICIWVSGAGGFHLYALQDPYVTVSRHTAPTVQPMAESQIPKTQVVWVHGLQCDLTSGSP